jgi:hypothetical protein
MLRVYTLKQAWSMNYCSKNTKAIVVCPTRCNQAAQPFVDYIVPETIAGPMPVYNRATITLYLMNYCREQQFQVVLLNASTGAMRISGWAEQYKRKQKQIDSIEVYSGNEKKLSSHLKQLVHQHRK